MIPSVDITSLERHVPPRSLLMAASVVMALLLLGGTVWWRINTSVADVATYRVLSTVNYGSLSIDAQPTPWLSASITLGPGSHTLVLRARPFTVACVVSLPHRSDDDCLTDEGMHTLTLAPHVADLPEADLRQLLNYGQFPQFYQVATLPQGALYRPSTPPAALTTVTTATTPIHATLWAGMADMEPRVTYDGLPGYDTEVSVRDGSHAQCLAYPLCDATSIIPHVTDPPYFLISVPLMTGWEIDGPLDTNIQRIDVPIEYQSSAAVHWVGDPTVLAPLVTSTLCNYERQVFQTVAHSATVPYFTLMPAHGCQAHFVDAGPATGGQLAISDGVIYLDGLAHQAFPAFPTFAQQVQ